MPKSAHTSVNGTPEAQEDPLTNYAPGRVFAGHSLYKLRSVHHAEAYSFMKMQKRDLDF